MNKETAKYYKQLLLNTVNFENGYGLSNNWIGFFECKIKFSEKIAVKAIDLFCNYFSSCINDFITATSLFIDNDNIINKKIKLSNMAEELSKDNYIKIINGKNYFDEDQAIWEKQYNELVFNFMIKQSNKNIIEKLSYLIIADDNTDGHCFFVSEENDLIIYPHEDTGYGFIGIKNKNNKTAIDFLEKIYKENEFGGHMGYIK
jgi:hypothetical protein